MTAFDTLDHPDVETSTKWTAGRALTESSRSVLVAASVTSVAVVAMIATMGLAWPSGITIVALVPAVLVDVIDHRLPNRLVGGAAAIGALGAAVGVAVGLDAAIVDVAVGAALVAGPLLLAHLVSPASMGFGDVKFAIVLGAAIGFVDPASSLIALAVGSLLATAHGLASRQRSIAFGPALLIGAVLALALHASDASTFADTAASHSTGKTS